MRSRPLLPHQSDQLFVTDGGTETWLMYKRGLELPHFCSFYLLDLPAGREALKEYYRGFVRVAQRHRAHYIFCSLTYRASRDWGELLGYSRAGLAEMNHKAFALYREVAQEMACSDDSTLYSGCIGPRGDAYNLKQTMSAEQAQDYHAEQIATFRAAGADLVTAMTLNSAQEAIGIARAARAAGVPAVISFTLEKDGTVGGRASLRETIEQVDAETGNAPAYYMLNCTHPQDFLPALGEGPWMQRVLGLRANASSLEHGRLCQLGRLEEGDWTDLARQHGELTGRYPRMNVFGGCCGTDSVHVAGIVDAICARTPAGRFAR